MAALAQPDFNLIDLRRVGVWELDPLLLAETVEWHERLDWDYSKSADLVRKFASSASLSGAALMEGSTVSGYGYTVIEDGKGLIGDVYVRPELRGKRVEAALFHALLHELVNAPAVRRVESQLMLVDRATALTVGSEGGLRLYERTLMSCGTAALLAQSTGESCPGFRLEPWGEQWNEAAAVAITLAYRGHVDAEINEQYRAFGAAARFLKNLMDYPGCGTFFTPASFVAFDRVNNRPAGVVLCSFVGPGVGHITQLCTTPDVRGLGLGKALLFRAARRLADAGAVRIGLTVTLENRAALKLYERCGFRELRRFFAYIRDA